MRAYPRAHVIDRDLLGNAKSHVAQDRATTAELLADLAEIDLRKLHVRAGYPSLLDYCVHDLGLSEDSALKRIQVARAARRFPAIFDAVAEGRLHLTGVRLLAPHLTTGNADELLAAAAHRTKAAIEELLAQRFPRSETLALVEALPASPHPGRVGASRRERVGESPEEHAPGHVEATTERSTVKPHAPQRFALHLTIGQETYDLLRCAQELQSHQIPSGDVARVIHRALRFHVRHLEKRKFAATTKPRPRSRRSSTNPRYIPAQVRRAVRERDQGCCTFVSETGHRCSERRFLEYDHVDTVARGGQATVENVRLLCRAHNQHTAEQTFGAGFMEDRREEARRPAAEVPAVENGHAAAGLRDAEEARARAVEAEARAAAARERSEDIIAGLRNLGFRAEQARHAAEHCATLPESTLDEHLRAAIKYLCPKPQGSSGDESGGTHLTRIIAAVPTTQ